LRALQQCKLSGDAQNTGATALVLVVAASISFSSYSIISS